MSELRLTTLDAELAKGLRCPTCRAPLTPTAEALRCSDGACGSSFPVVDGIPVLVDGHQSAFTAEGVVRDHARIGLVRPSQAEGSAYRFLRSLPKLIDADRVVPHFRKLAALLTDRASARVLVVGGGSEGVGLRELLQVPGLRLVPTDVYASEETLVVCDGHHLPFDDELFDAVVVQSVLEHVAHPPEVVAELHRVLRRDGFIYAETPFLYPVHEGRYDFTRYTRRGHRLLFAGFEEIESGADHGPGTTLAITWRYFLRSFGGSRAMRGALYAVAAVTGFWLKALDGFLLRRPGAEDVAAGFYFIGRRSETRVSDADVIALYDDSRD